VPDVPLFYFISSNISLYLTLAWNIKSLCVTPDVELKHLVRSHLAHHHV